MSDPVYGGMKGVPKFPIGYQWNFMIHYDRRTEDSRSLFLAERTLDMMQRGGIYDHLGGGFSATAWMSSGWSPTLKRCFMTMPF